VWAIFSSFVVYFISVIFFYIIHIYFYLSFFISFVTQSFAFLSFLVIIFSVLCTLLQALVRLCDTLAWDYSAWRGGLPDLFLFSVSGDCLTGSKMEQGSLSIDPSNHLHQSTVALPSSSSAHDLVDETGRLSCLESQVIEQPLLTEESAAVVSMPFFHSIDHHVIILVGITIFPYKYPCI
jgi:hypothetical protein